MNLCRLVTTATLTSVLLPFGLVAIASVVPYRVPSRLPDALEPLPPEAVRLDGWLGQRVQLNARNRLAKVDLEPLLAGFRRKPGSHPWIGEHIGKWMHAATLAWASTGDPELRRKLDAAAAELVQAQEPDGYLGTYVPEKRFGLYPGSDWDVWSHKYNLIGLLTYHRYTGDPAALEACRKMGDLLVNTFGPGKKSLLAAGTHIGMAATSVLEPMVLLYRATGDERYLAFCRYIVRCWDEPDGPKLIASLLAHGQVNKTANAKAYEMLSNLVGLCELARATGDRALLTPVLNAWHDIVSKRLYLTGSASQGEHFRDDYELPNQPGAHVAETCVTTTWIQLNTQLLRLTGEARFGHELEKTFYNHLAAAQRPDGAQWCYFTALEGTKPYGPGINCCVSSGPRGIALVTPNVAFTVAGGRGEPAGLALNLVEASRITTALDGQVVTLEHETDFPRGGRHSFVVRCASPVRFALQIRVPAWSPNPRLDAAARAKGRWELREGWLRLPARRWKDGERFAIELPIAARAIAGEHGNAGKLALAWGPFVLAFDQQRNPGLPAPQMVGFATLSEPPFRLRSGPGEPLSFAAGGVASRPPAVREAVFVPFADAGGDGGRYAVWLRAPGIELPRNDSLFAFADESRSRQGNVEGSITDGDFETFVVTFDNRRQDEAWFAVQTPNPVTLRRVVFAHGRNFHDGGWFDTGNGKPRVEIRRTAASEWERVGELATYPATTATDHATLTGGEPFTVTFREPLEAIAVRVIGKPACGDNPAQAFASCAELQAFAD